MVSYFGVTVKKCESNIMISLRKTINIKQLGNIREILKIGSNIAINGCQELWQISVFNSKIEHERLQ